METIRAYKFYSARWGLDALYRRRLKVSTGDDINDPFEFLATGRNQASRKEANRIRGHLFSSTGVISFSKTWREPLLWSHYADNHRGVALGFDIKGEIGNHVSYTGRRIQMPARAPSNVKLGDSLRFWDAIRITKFSAWCYEKELRVFPSLDGSIVENGLYFRPFEDIGVLKEVILGANYTSVGNPDLETNLRERGVAIVTSRLAFQNFSVTTQNASNRQKKI